MFSTEISQATEKTFILVSQKKSKKKSKNKKTKTKNTEIKTKKL